MFEKVRNRLGGVLLSGSLLLCAALLFHAGVRKEPLIIEASGRFQAIEPVSVFQKGTLHVNSADTEELTQLYGIGETLASIILEEREANGPFYYPADLTQVKGIGPAKLARFQDMLDMSIDESGGEE